MAKLKQLEKTYKVNNFDLIRKRNYDSFSQN